MRWKLLVLVSFVAALLALGLWSAITIAVFGSARALARNDWLLLCSLVIPLGVATYAGVFVYRHTAKRRKLQALIAIVLTLILTVAAYFAGSKFFPHSIGIISSPCDNYPCDKSSLTRTRLLFLRPQSNLCLHRLQGIDHEPNVLIQFNAQLSDTLVNIFAIN